MRTESLTESFKGLTSMTLLSDLSMDQLNRVISTLQSIKIVRGEVLCEEVIVMRVIGAMNDDDDDNDDD